MLKQSTALIILLFQTPSKPRLPTQQVDIVVLEDEVYWVIPEGNEWKIILMNEIINVRNGNLEIENFDEEENKEILNYICII